MNKLIHFCLDGITTFEDRSIHTLIYTDGYTRVISDSFTIGTKYSLLLTWYRKPAASWYCYYPVKQTNNYAKCTKLHYPMIPKHAILPNEFLGMCVLFTSYKVC